MSTISSCGLSCPKENGNHKHLIVLIWNLYIVQETTDWVVCDETDCLRVSNGGTKLYALLIYSTYMLH